MRKSNAYGTGYLFRQKYRDRHGKLKQAKTFTIAYSHEGHERRESTGETVYKKALDILKDRLASKNIPTAETKGLDLEGLLELLEIDYRTENRSSWAQVSAYRLPPLRRYFGKTDPNRIDRKLLIRYADQRIRAGASNVTVNRERSAMVRALRLAADRGLVTSIPRVAKLREPDARKGFMEKADFERVLAVIDPWWHELFRVAYITGWRTNSELLPMKWPQVDFRHKFIRIEPGVAKNREPRMFPFTPELERLLKAQREKVTALAAKKTKDIPLVFPRKRQGAQLKRAYHLFKDAAEVVGLTDRMPHDLRRTAVRNLEFAGVDRATAMAMVGHKTEAIYRRYNIVDSRRIEVARAKMTAYEEVGT